MKPIALYETTITHAHSIWDTGTRYTIAPITFPVVGNLIDKRDLDGYSADPDRVLVLNPDVEIYIDVMDMLVLKLPKHNDYVPETMLLSEIIGHDGTILFAEYGQTRKIVAGEATIGLDEITTLLSQRDNQAIVRDIA